jgi:hypothetical protein
MPEQCDAPPFEGPAQRSLRVDHRARISYRFLAIACKGGISCPLPSPRACAQGGDNAQGRIFVVCAIAVSRMRRRNQERSTRCARAPRDLPSAYGTKNVPSLAPQRGEGLGRGHIRACSKDQLLPFHCSNLRWRAHLRSPLPNPPPRVRAREGIFIACAVTVLACAEGIKNVHSLRTRRARFAQRPTAPKMFPPLRNSAGG